MKMKLMFELITLLEKYSGKYKRAKVDGCSMLHYAATNGSLRTIKYIASKGADPKAICRNEKPSQWANKNKDKRVKKIFRRVRAVGQNPLLLFKTFALKLKLLK